MLIHVNVCIIDHGHCKKEQGSDLSIDSSDAPCRLVEECWDDPLTCTTSYVSPDPQPKETSIQQFKDFIVNSFVVKIVPLVMVKVCYIQ